MIGKVQLKDGKVKWNQDVRFLQRVDRNRWRSGIFSQDVHHCNFFTKFRLGNLQTRSSSCLCSTTSIGQEKEMMEFVFRIQKKSRNSRKDSRKDIGRSSVLERKRSGMELFLYTPEGKWDSTVAQMVERFKDTGHPEFKSISALSRGILKKKNNRDTIHINADASKTELLFRIIHSVNQFSIYGAVSNWCEKFGLIADERGQERIHEKGESVTKEILKGVNSQEVNSLVPPRPAYGNRSRGNIQDFESLSETNRFTRVCEDAIFVHRVASGMSYKTRLDEDDGFGQLIPLCREETFSRVNPRSRAFATIPLTSVKLQEVKLLVSSPRVASGNSLRVNIQDFESLSETMRLTRVCEGALFVHQTRTTVLGRSFHCAENTFPSKPTGRNNCWTSH